MSEEMRKFAFFLPQFHEIPENNEWWGEGFTEWTNVKKANPYFRGHRQPKHPLNNNYYNLMDKSTVEWQTKLMHQYCVDGLIYYHYYFCGKRLLEKPAENLLKWQDIDQSFFFCWANHDWNRTWEGKRSLLMKQTYGRRQQWEEHFQYLLPFFRDKRYEKKDNMPLFMIYMPYFAEKNDMMTYLDTRCKEVGFDGLYLIESYMGMGDSFWRDDYKKFKNDLICPVTKRIYMREATTAFDIYKDLYRYYPERAIKKIAKFIFRTMNKIYVTRFNGNHIYEVMMNKEPYEEEIIHGSFFEWDNTPRHKERGYVIMSPSKKTYLKYMDKIKNSDYVFINAWNEWAEGMMLEPTEENGYKYLEWIREWTQKAGSKS